MDYNDLRNAVNRGLSTREIGRLFGKSQTTTRYWLSKHGLVTSKIKKSNHCAWCGKTIALASRHCSNACIANSKAFEIGLLWEEGDLTVLTDSQLRTGLFTGLARRYIFLRYGNRCTRCGWTYDFEDGGFPPLEISHTDGDYSNNAFSNLELLCPNCHAVETRLKPVRKGNGRWLNGGDTRNK